MGLRGEGGGGIDWVGIYIGEKKRKNWKQSPDILNKAPTKASKALNDYTETKKTKHNPQILDKARNIKQNSN